MSDVVVNVTVPIRKLVNIPADINYVDAVPHYKRIGEIDKEMWIIESNLVDDHFKYYKIWKSGNGYMKQSIPLQPCFIPALDAWMDENAT